MPDPHIKEITELNSAFAELSRVIPTSALEEYQKSLNTVAILHQKSADEIEALSKSMETLTKGTSVSKNELARFTAGYVESTNRLSLSLTQFQRIAVDTSKIDPFNTQERVRGILEMTRQYGSLTQGLADGSRKSTTALRLMNLALQDGNESMAGFFQTMARGGTAQDNFASKQERVVKILKDVKLGFAGFIGDSKVIDSALGILSNHTAATLASLAAAGAGVHFVGNVYKGLTHGAGAAGGAAARGATPLARLVRRIPGRLLGGAAAIGLGAYEYSHAENEHDKAAAVGGTLGGLVLGALGTAFGGPVVGIGLGLLGNKLGREVAETFTGPVVKTAEQIMTERADQIEQEMAEKTSTRIRSIQTTQGTIAGLIKEYDPLEQKKRGLEARMSLAEGAAGLGLVGPGAQIRIAQQQVSYTEGLINKLTEAHKAFLSEVGHSAAEITAANEEYTISVDQLRLKELGQIKTIRRSIIEQFTASSINSPSGTYSMPGGLSDRQKYGGSYMDFMPLENISSRPKQQRYDAMSAVFYPIQNKIAKQINQGYASGGLIPGTPSSSDNTISAVASGEYVVNASAVSHYGSRLFDALNRKTAPRFAGGGGWGLPGWDWIDDKIAQTFGYKPSVKEIPTDLSTANDYIRNMGGIKIQNNPGYAALAAATGRQIEATHYHTTDRAGFSIGDSLKRPLQEAMRPVIQALEKHNAHMSLFNDVKAYNGGTDNTTIRAIKKLLGDDWGTHNERIGIGPTGNNIKYYGGSKFGWQLAGAVASADVTEHNPFTHEGRDVSTYNHEGGHGGHIGNVSTYNHEGGHMGNVSTSALLARAARSHHRWHPSFGKSPFGEVVLGGRGPGKAPDLFSADVFHGGGHMDMQHATHVKNPLNGNHRNTSNTPELKKLDEINKSIITMGDKIADSFKGYVNNSVNS
jgi:hypothetical protein